MRWQALHLRFLFRAELVSVVLKRKVAEGAVDRSNANPNPAGSNCGAQDPEKGSHLRIKQVSGHSFFSSILLN